MLLEHLDDDRDRRVDRVGDDADERFGCRLGNSRREIADDSGVNLRRTKNYIHFATNGEKRVGVRFVS